MKGFIKKFGFYIAFTIIFLVISLCYKISYIDKKKTENVNIPEIMRGKTIVKVWVKDSHTVDLRSYQVYKYNMENKDNIYIDFKAFADDYYSVLKTALATGNGPEIFEYGYYDLFKNKLLMDINDLGINIDKYGKENFLYFNKVPMGLKVSVNDVKITWNKDLFKQAGISDDFKINTWEDLIYASEKLKNKFPDIIPFEFPAYTVSDTKISIGGPSAVNNNIYTTFWDYKNGKYDFNCAKEILSVYNKMYSKGLISKEFTHLNKNLIRQDFYSGKAAIIMSTYEDKDYFKNILPLNFSIGVSDLPGNKDGNRKYYYTDNFTCFVVNKDANNINSVKKVYEWLACDNVNKEMLQASKALPAVKSSKTINRTNTQALDQYDNDNLFKNEVYDPTIYINYNINETQNILYNAIMGKISIDHAVDTLNKNFEHYCNFMVEQFNFDFKEFTEK